MLPKILHLICIATNFLFQTMLNLYREEQGLEELLSAAELQSLIIATASLWDQCNLSWKAPTGCVLRTISKAQTKTAIMYLQGLFFPEHLWNEFL